MTCPRSALSQPMAGQGPVCRSTGFLAPTRWCSPVMSGVSGLVGGAARRDSSLVRVPSHPAHTGMSEARLEGRAGQKINFVLL